MSLFLYPMDAWKKIEEKLSSLDTLNAEVRQFQRTVLRATDEVEMDQQGRIMISPVLRKEAGLGKSVVIVGMLHRVEIWDKERSMKTITRRRRSPWNFWDKSSLTRAFNL